MYQYPVILPTVSNREDFNLTVAMFDDDTGDPIKLDGCFTASGMPFTSGAWTVTSGAAVTTSSTVLTIPVFPIASAAQASLFLFVGTNQAIAPGAPVTIKDTATGLNYMIGYVVSYTTSTGALVVQIGMVFLFEIRRTLPRDDLWGLGYSSYPAVGSYPDTGPLLKATLGQGIAITDIGYLQIIIPASMFQQLVGGTYSAALVTSDGIATRQIFAGTLPVIQGGVTRSPFTVSAGPLWN